MTDDEIWRESAQEELHQLIDDMLHTEKTHMSAAERLQNLHRRLGVISTVLSGAAGATIFAERSSLTAGLLALGATVASGILTFMKPEAAAEQHLGAGRQLAAVRVRARQMLELDLHRLPIAELRGMITAVAEQKAKVDDAGPGTTSRDYGSARAKIKAGTFKRDK